MRILPPRRAKWAPVAAEAASTGTQEWATSTKISWRNEDKWTWRFSVRAMSNSAKKKPPLLTQSCHPQDRETVKPQQQAHLASNSAVVAIHKSNKVQKSTILTWSTVRWFKATQSVARRHYPIKTFKVIMEISLNYLLVVTVITTMLRLFHLTINGLDLPIVVELVRSKFTISPHTQMLYRQATWSLNSRILVSKVWKVAKTINSAVQW